MKKNSFLMLAMIVTSLVFASCKEKAKDVVTVIHTWPNRLQITKTVKAGEEYPSYDCNLDGWYVADYSGDSIFVIRQRDWDNDRSLQAVYSIHWNDPLASFEETITIVRLYPEWGVFSVEAASPVPLYSIGRQLRTFDGGIFVWQSVMNGEILAASVSNTLFFFRDTGFLSPYGNRSSGFYVKDYMMYDGKHNNQGDEDGFIFAPLDHHKNFINKNRRTLKEDSRSGDERTSVRGKYISPNFRRYPNF
ncbi:MAG: hypothetical protein LBM06_08570 [Prevotellaceae bacterium]|jgi:hypothetical protein|nr:hypothetical protein [Prevotellaceae bacterium]